MNSNLHLVGASDAPRQLASLVQLVACARCQVSLLPRRLPAN